MDTWAQYKLTKILYFNKNPGNACRRLCRYNHAPCPMSVSGLLVLGYWGYVEAIRKDITKIAWKMKWKLGVFGLATTPLGCNPGIRSGVGILTVATPAFDCVTFWCWLGGKEETLKQRPRFGFQGPLRVSRLQGIDELTCS